MSNKTPSTIFEKSIFVDASGWLAYLDKRNANHKAANEVIGKQQWYLITSDRELVHLSNIADHKISKRSLVLLVWRLRRGEVGTVVRVSNKDQIKAWRLFYGASEPGPSFNDCISFVLLSRLKVNNLLTFSSWLDKKSKFAVL